MEHSTSSAAVALKGGDYEYAKTVALVEIAESLTRLANIIGGK